MTQGMIDGVASLFGFAQRQIDRVVSPERRQRTYSQASDFATARPLLAAFIVTQVIFGSIPTLLFLCFSGTTLLFAASAAFLFTLFWVGAGLIVLLPILCLTFSIALCVWVWVAASFTAGRSALGTVQSLLPPTTVSPAPVSPSHQVEAGGGSASTQPSSRSPSTPPSWSKLSDASSDTKDFNKGEEKKEHGKRDGKDDKARSL